jgi:predicted Zn-dependent peptidase
MLDRSVPPPIYPIQNFSLKKPISQVLKNQIPLHFINVGVQPVLSMQLVFPNGAYLADNPTVSHFTAKMLLEGTEQKTASQITNEIDKYGAFLDIGAVLEEAYADFHCLNKYLHHLLDLLVELLSYPTFPEHELEKLKSIAIQNIRINNEKTNFIASNKFRANLFGENHPYGYTTTEEAVNQLDRELLLQHFHKIFYQKPFWVIVAGAFSEKEMKLISDYLEHLPIEKEWAKNEKEYLKVSKTEATYIEKPNAVQTSIRIGKEVLKRQDKDFAVQLVLNTILGGYFGSRLMSNIREDKGLSYGISSQLSILKNATYMMIGTDVKKEQRQIALNEIYKEIQKLTQEPVSQKELDLVKNYMKGTFVNSLNTPFAIAEKFKTIYSFGLPEDYYDYHVQRIDAVTAEQVLDLANRLYKEDFIEVMAG